MAAIFKATHSGKNLSEETTMRGARKALWKYARDTLGVDVPDSPKKMMEEAQVTKCPTLRGHIYKIKIGRYVLHLEYIDTDKHERLVREHGQKQAQA